MKFFIHPDGSNVLLPKLPVAALRGMLNRPRSRVTIKQMGAAIAVGAAADWTNRRNRKRP